MIPAGGVLFLGLTMGVVLLLEIVDQRVKSPADIAMIPRTRVLGFVPHAAEDPTNPAKVETVFRDQPGGVLAESYRHLRGTILKRMQAAGHKSLVCMSGMPGSGSTTIVVNLAYALAAAEQRVLLIDANFRRPSVHRVLGLNEASGLAEVIAGTKNLAEVVQKTEESNLSVLSAGAPEDRKYERLTGSAMTNLLKSAAANYDIILIDVAPAMIAGDAVGLANRCDASMLVVRALGEKRGMVARLRNELSEARAEFLGVVVNAVRSSAGGYLKGNILAAHNYQTGTGGNGKAA
jgi:capsular exopolysaccharide synthesis family protein